MCIGHQWPPVTVVFHLSWCWLRIINQVALWSGDHLMTLLYHASNGIGLPGPKKATCSAVHKNPLTLLPAGIKDHPGPHWIENCKNSLEKDKRLCTLVWTGRHSSGQKQTVANVQCFQMMDLTGRGGYVVSSLRCSELQPLALCASWRSAAPQSWTGILLC